MSDPPEHPDVHDLSLPVEHHHVLQSSKEGRRAGREHVSARRQPGKEHCTMNQHRRDRSTNFCTAAKQIERAHMHQLIRVRCLILPHPDNPALRSPLQPPALPFSRAPPSSLAPHIRPLILPLTRSHASLPFPVPSPPPDPHFTMPSSTQLPSVDSLGWMWDLQQKKGKE